MHAITTRTMPEIANMPRTPGITCKRAPAANNALTGLETPVAAHACDGSCHPSMELAQQCM